MRNFISESIKDLSIGFIVGSVIALLIDKQISTGAVTVLFTGVVLWFLALALKPI